MTNPLLSDENPLPPPTLNGQGQTQAGPEMTMLEHLEELRRRIVTSVISLVLGIVIAFSGVTPAMNILKILAPPDSHFIQLTPGEVFMSAFRLATFMGIALASPVILYQLLRFILPGLKPHESRFLLWMVLGGAFLFLGGMVFGYYAVLPPTLEWLLGFGAEVAEVNMSIGRFVEFCTGMILLCGVLFELPVLLFLLSFTHLVNSHKLLSQWRMATIIIFVAAAVLTPSQDPLTLSVVGGALMALYFLSVMSIRLCGR